MRREKTILTIRFLADMSLLTACMLLFLIIVYVGIAALEREREMRDGIRDSRCERAERLKQEALFDYCKKH